MSGSKELDGFLHFNLFETVNTKILSISEPLACDIRFAFNEAHDLNC